MRVAGTLLLDSTSLTLNQGGNKTVISAGSPSGNVTITLPSTTDTVVGRATTDTLTNKTLGSTNTLTGATTANFTVGGNTLTLPAATDTLVGRATTDTLTNKTLTSPTINDAAISGGTITGATFSGSGVSGDFDIDGNLILGNNNLTITNPTQTDVSTLTIPDLGGVNQEFALTAATQTLTNKTLTSPKINENVALTTTATKLNFLTNATGTTGTTSTNLVFSTSPTLVTPVLGAATATSVNGLTITSTTGTLTLVNGSTLATAGAFSTTLTSTNTTNVTLPTTGTLATLAGSESLSNKTLPNVTITGASTTIQDGAAIIGTADATKRIQFSAAGAATGTFTQLNFSQTTNRTLTMPDATDTLAGIAATQTFTNKTLGPTNAVTLVDSTGFTLQDSGDSSKLQKFDVSSSQTTATTRTQTLPTTTGVLLNDNNAVTMANKSIEDSTTTFYDTADSSKGFLLDVPTAQTTGTTRTHTLPAVSSTLASLAGTEVLTNKDIDGGTASNSHRITIPKDTLANITALTRKEGTILYATDTDKFYSDDGSNLSEVGSGSGSGELNEVLNPSASATTTGWTNGTSHTGSRVTTGSPLDPLVATAFTVVSAAATAESSTSGFYYSIGTLATALRSKKLKCEFYVVVPSADVWRLSVYQGSTRLALSTDSSSVTTLPAGFTGKFTAYFDTTTGTAYSVNFTKTTRAGSGNDLTFTNLIVGPGIQPQGAVIEPWVSYTPTGTWSTNTTYAGYKRRVGDTAEYEITVSLSGAPTSANLSINQPTGETIDIARTSGNRSIFGDVNVYDNDGTGAGRLIGTMVYESSTTLTAYAMDNNDTTNAYMNIVTQAFPITFTTSDKVLIRYTVPISEWAGSGTVNVAQNDVEYASNSSTTDASDTTSFAYGPGGSQFGNFTTNRQKTVRFQTPIRTTDIIKLQGTFDSGVTWLDIGQFGETVAPYSIQNTNEYGASVILGSSNEVIVKFYKYRLASGTTFGAAGTDWSGIDVDPVYKWRVVKMAGGQAVGFGNVAQSTSGLVKSAGQLLGTNTNDDAASGFVGEFVRSVVSTPTNVTGATDVYGNFTTISLTTAGDWDITGMVQFSANGATLAAGSADLYLSQFTTTTTTDRVLGDNHAQQLPPTATAPSCISIPNWRISTTGATTVYLKGRIGYTVGTPQYICRLSARRIR